MRLKCISTRDVDFIKHAGMKLHHFREREYPDEILSHALKMVSTIERATLLEIREADDNNEDIVALRTIFIPHSNALPKIVKKNWALQRRSSMTKKLLESKLIISYPVPKICVITL